MRKSWKRTKRHVQAKTKTLKPKLNHGHPMLGPATDERQRYVLRNGMDFVVGNSCLIRKVK